MPGSQGPEAGASRERGEEGSRAPASSPACHGTKDPHQEHPGGSQMVGTGQVLRDPKRACLLWDQLSSALLLGGRTVSPVPRKDSSQPSVSTLPDCRSRMRVKQRHFQTHEVPGMFPSRVLSRGCQRTFSAKATGGSKEVPGPREGDFPVGVFRHRLSTTD